MLEGADERRGRYDTLKIARQLADAGLDPKVTEGVSATLGGVLVEREDTLATKSDILALKSDVSELRAELKGEIRSVNLEMMRWMIATQIAIGTLIFAAIKFIH